MKDIESGAVLCPLLTQNWAARLVAVLNGAQAMLVVRLDGAIIAASGQTAALLGRPPAALVGCARGAGHAPDAAALRRLRAGLTITERIGPDAATGRTTWVQVTRTPMRDSGGQLALLMEQYTQIEPDEEPTIELTPVARRRPTPGPAQPAAAPRWTGVCW